MWQRYGGGLRTKRIRHRLRGCLWFQPSNVAWQSRCFQEPYYCFQLMHLLLVQLNVVYYKSNHSSVEIRMQANAPFHADLSMWWLCEWFVMSDCFSFLQFILKTLAIHRNNYQNFSTIFHLTSTSQWLFLHK